METRTDLNLERVAYYQTKCNFTYDVAVWAALHENLPEFRELKFTPESGIIMPEVQKKRDPEFLEDKPCPAWISKKDFENIKRYYWQENLNIKDCAHLMGKTEQEIRNLVHDVKTWNKSKKMVKCPQCHKFHNEETMFTDTLCGNCYKTNLKKVYV